MTTFRFRQREFVRIIEANLLGPVTDRFNQVCSHSHLLRLSAIEGLFDCLDTKCVSLKALDLSENHLGWEGFSHVVTLIQNTKEEETLKTRGT